MVLVPARGCPAAEGVLPPEQAVELRNHRMVVWNCLSFELAQSSLDLCGSQLHRTLLFRLARALTRSHAMFGCLRGLPPQVVKREANSVIPQALN